MLNNETIAIIGAGKLGVALAYAFSAAQLPVVVGSRNAQRAKTDLSEFTSNNLAVTSPNDAAKSASVILLTCADQDISLLCEQISSHINPGTVVTHCSGALPSTLLNSAKHRGAHIASTHPLNTFPTLAAAVKLLSRNDHNTTVYAEGESSALKRLEPLWQLIGFEQKEIATQAKTLYHAACATACNYMTATIDLSLDIATAAGMKRNEFAESLAPLLQATLNNIKETGTLNSLSGPVARGDALTIKSHLEALDSIEQGEEAVQLYRLLARHALKMAEQKDLTKDQITELNNALKNS